MQIWRACNWQKLKVKPTTLFMMQWRLGQACCRTGRTVAMISLPIAQEKPCAVSGRCFELRYVLLLIIIVMIFIIIIIIIIIIIVTSIVSIAIMLV